jgi:hypothetical protein
MFLYTSYLCYKDDKKNISDDSLEIAGRGKAESSNSNEYHYFECIILDYIVDLYATAAGRLKLNK